MSYSLALSLVRLRTQINTLYPDRDKGSDGWIGDASHNARKSDHNPDYADGGVVRALDIDKDGINVNTVLSAVVGDSRVAYVIWNRRIWTHADGWQPYRGANGHTAHIHVSIRHTDAAEAPTAWDLPGSNITPTKTPAAPAAKAWPEGKLKVTESHTLPSHQAWRELMRREGYTDKSLTTNLQRWLKKLGHYKGLIEADKGKTPVFGPVLVEALQALLVKNGFLPSKHYIDGNRQAKTIRGEISYLNDQAQYYRKKK